MKLNQNSHFSLTPAAVNMQRSVLDRSSELLTTLDAAGIVPIYCDEILPGDSVKMKVNALIRMTTSIHATMDRVYDDVYFFFIPNRLVWDSWEEFCGANPNPWITNQPVHSIPQLTLTGGTTVGSLANYLGIPLGYSNKVNALPFRAYNKVINDWFRNTNLQSDIAVPTGDTGDLVSYYTVRKATKFKDYFTSALPSPQRGPDVDIPLGQNAPIITGTDFQSQYASGGKYPGPMIFSRLSLSTGNLSSTAGSSSNNIEVYNSNGRAFVDTTNTSHSPSNSTYVVPTNLYADLSQASAATINQLRLAFQTQKFYERMGIATGGRYVSILKTMFGVTSPDYRLQRSEYLGGSRTLISMQQVTQSSETSTTPLGTVAGQSVTRLSNHLFHKGFTEHGILLGVTVIRPKHTYQYGIDKMFSRKSLFDFYWPTFAYIGEQPILNKEIYAQGDSVVDSNGKIIDNQVFGYQEAWAEYRYKPNRINGYFSSGATGSLESWHYGDKYSGLPTLGNTWIEETDANIARTLAVQSGVHQFMAHFAFTCKHARVMPVYSIPGLIDHF